MLTANQSEFMKRTLVPFLKRQLLEEQDLQQIPNHVQQSGNSCTDCTTQTFDIFSVQKFDPVSIFYQNQSSLPSHTESMTQMKLQLSQQHRSNLDSALSMLTEQHKITINSLNDCLQAERSARKNENEFYTKQIQCLQQKLEAVELEKRCNLCYQCQKITKERNDIYVQESEEHIDAIELQNRDLKKNINSLQQNQEQLIDDYKNELQQKQVLQNKVKDLEESCRLYQQLIQKLQNMQKFNQHINTNLLYQSVLSSNNSNSTNQTSSSVSSEGVFQLQNQLNQQNQQIQLKMREQQQQAQLALLQQQILTNPQTINQAQLNYSQFVPQGLPPLWQQQQQMQNLVQQQINPNSHQMNFTQDTTPPACAHIQIPPSLQQQIPQQKVVNLTENQNQTLTTSANTPNRPDRDQSSVKHSEINKIAPVLELSDSDNKAPTTQPKSLMDIIKQMTDQDERPASVVHNEQIEQFVEKPVVQQKELTIAQFKPVDLPKAVSPPKIQEQNKSNDFDDFDDFDGDDFDNDEEPEKVIQKQEISDFDKSPSQDVKQAPKYNIKFEAESMSEISDPFGGNVEIQF